MRIIAGSLGGRKLSTVESEGFRPAMGRTREALFSMLAARGLDFSASACLDLFAASGSLGLEAISRGAPRAVFVENSAKALRCLAQNIANLGLLGQAQAIKEDALRFLRRRPTENFALAFIDPPYGKNLAFPALNLLLENAWLAPGSFICAEIEKGIALSEIAGVSLVGERLFGQTQLLIWKKQAIG